MIDDEENYRMIKILFSKSTIKSEKRNDYKYDQSLKYIHGYQ